MTLFDSVFGLLGAFVVAVSTGASQAKLEAAAARPLVVAAGVLAPTVEAGRLHLVAMRHSLLHGLSSAISSIKQIATAVKS